MRTTNEPAPGYANSFPEDLFPPEGLIAGASLRYEQAISRVTPNATSSPGSADGVMRSSSPDGQKTAGLAHVPVSRFRALESESAMPTNDTCGPLFLTSSPSAGLQRSLESRLRARMDASGSAEYELTWREQDMPAGLPICALRASGRRTSGKGSTGWATPTSRDHKDTGDISGVPENSLLGRQAHQASGVTASSSSAATGRRGALNPAFSLWLMGFPAGWVSCGVRAMQSFRKSRRNS